MTSRAPGRAVSIHFRNRIAYFRDQRCNFRTTDYRSTPIKATKSASPIWKPPARGSPRPAFLSLAVFCSRGPRFPPLEAAVWLPQGFGLLSSPWRRRFPGTSPRSSSHSAARPSTIPGAPSLLQPLSPSKRGAQKRSGRRAAASAPAQAPLRGDPRSFPAQRPAGIPRALPGHRPAKARQLPDLAWPSPEPGSRVRRGASSSPGCLASPAVPAPPSPGESSGLLRRTSG